jgi:hypothetical protein
MSRRGRGSVQVMFKFPFAMRGVKDFSNQPCRMTWSSARLRISISIDCRLQSGALDNILTKSLHPGGGLKVVDTAVRDETEKWSRFSIGVSARSRKLFTLERLEQPFPPPGETIRTKSLIFSSCGNLALIVKTSQGSCIPSSTDQSMMKRKRHESLTFGCYKLAFK